MDHKCEMNASVLWNMSSVTRVLFNVGIFACMSKIVIH